MAPTVGEVCFWASVLVGSPPGLEGAGYGPLLSSSCVKTQWGCRATRAIHAPEETPADVPRLSPEVCIAVLAVMSAGEGDHRASEPPHRPCGLKCRQTGLCLDYAFSINGKGQLGLKKQNQNPTLRDYFLHKSQFPQI